MVEAVGSSGPILIFKRWEQWSYSNLQAVGSSGGSGSTLARRRRWGAVYGGSSDSKSDFPISSLFKLSGNSLHPIFLQAQPRTLLQLIRFSNEYPSAASPLKGGRVAIGLSASSLRNPYQWKHIDLAFLCSPLLLECQEFQDSAVSAVVGQY
nr:hypothetical protein Iba_chr13eCG7000 [Ipomoea batatas]